MKIRHLLLFTCAFTVAMSASAQADEFFGRELIVNGTAEQCDSEGLPAGWTRSNDSDNPIYAKTYELMSLEDLAAANAGVGVRLFTGGEGSFLGSSRAASYQTVVIPESAYEAIDANTSSCKASALIGGYESQDDAATLTFTFMNAEGGEISNFTLGPVSEDERGGVTMYMTKTATVQIPVGTRAIRTEIVSQKSSLGKDIDGYVDNVSLIAEQRNVNPQVNISGAIIGHGDELTIDYAYLPVGSHLYLYKDEAMLPLKSFVSPVDENTASGTLVLSTELEPGDYTVRCVDAYGAELIDELFFTVNARPYEPADKNILVMSDVHVMSPELLVSEGTAFDSYLASDRKLLVESESILKAMVDTVLALSPELVLITGDLTKDGEKLSHDLVASYLDELDAAGIKVLVIPGNHDVNNPHALYYDGETTDYAQTVTKEEFAAIYDKYGYGEGSERDPNSLSYVTEPYDGLVVIGIDACKYEENKFISNGDASDECVTSGRVKDETLQWISDKAEDAHRHGKQVIAMMHHNLVEHFNMQGSIAAPYVVDSAATVRQALMDAGINTVFTGHFHIQDIAMDYNDAKTDSIYDISTGSTVTYPCPFRRVRLNEDNTIMEITSSKVESLVMDGTEIDNFTSYAQNKLASGIAPMVTSLVEDNWDVIKHTLDSIVGSNVLISAVVTLPETADELSAMLIECFETPAIKAYLTFSESNEHLKYTDELVSEINAGIDKLIGKVVASWAVSIAKNLIAEKLTPLIDNVIGSLIGNVTNKGTDHENVKNDLYLTINLPKRTDVTGIEVESVEAEGLQVYPTLTDGAVTIVCPQLDEPAEIVIFDINGQIIRRMTVDAGEGRSIDYNFAAPGMYGVKMIGNGDAIKVIVR